MRDRGPRTRRSPYAPGDPIDRPPAPSRVNGWQALAILALIAATAGWTTAIVLATRPAAVGEATTPSQPDDAIPSDDGSLPPVADTHDAPELEALLPDKVKDTPLQLQSWTGDTILTDDGWSNSLNAFLTANEKKPTDLRVAQAYDPTQAFDGSVGIYKIAGIPPDKMRDALIAAWKVDFPDAPSSAIKVDGQDVTKVDLARTRSTAISTSAATTSSTSRRRTRASSRRRSPGCRRRARRPDRSRPGRPLRLPQPARRRQRPATRSAAELSRVSRKVVPPKGIRCGASPMIPR